MTVYDFHKLSSRLTRGIVDKGASSKDSAVRVFVAEANRLNCELIESALRSRRCHLEVEGCAVESRRAIEQLQSAHPDVALIGAQLSDGPLAGFRVLRELHVLASTLRTILLLDVRDRELIVDAFRSGAHGVVIRDEGIETLCKCIHAVHDGQIWANSQQLEYVVSALGHAGPVHVQDSRGAVLLSKREEDVVRLVMEGLTNREIGKELKLSQHTIRNYLFRIFEKLGISSRVELVLYCLQSRGGLDVRQAN
ncbi:MAG TPA: response regulator transcription factor [Candidatus Micrarchaeaceae archaeon]|nr:response regulator transcription factor [Candidatus Micrarchaeaceae archaeon]